MTLGAPHTDHVRASAQQPPGGFGAPPPGGGYGAPPAGGGGFGSPPPGGGGYGAPPGGGFGAPPPGVMGSPVAGGYGGPGAAKENNFAIAALICGAVSVVSLVCCCIPFANYAAYVLVPGCGIAAIILGILGIKEANVTGRRKNEAIAGIVLGSIGFLAMAIVLIGAVIGVAAMGSALSGVQ